MTFDGYIFENEKGRFWFPNMYNRQNTYHLMLLWLARNFAGDGKFEWRELDRVDGNADFLVDLDHISQIDPLNPPGAYDLTRPRMSSGSTTI